MKRNSLSFAHILPNSDDYYYYLPVPLSTIVIILTQQNTTDKRSLMIKSKMVSKVPRINYKEYLYQYKVIVKSMRGGGGEGGREEDQNHV